MLFDSHTHLNLAAFDSDRDLLLKRYLKEDIFMVNVGTCLETSQQALAISGEYSNCWASVGLHPSHTLPALLDPMELSSKFKIEKSRRRQRGSGASATKTKIINQNSQFIEPETFDENYLELLKNPKVVALGECGLDYSYLKNLSREKQEENKIRQEQEFRTQIQTAQKYHLPLILHLRNLYQEALKILKEENYQGQAVFHFFTGSLEDLKLILQNPQYLIGFSGVITYNNKLDEVIKNVPLDRLLIETDAPYVAPLPYRGKRNEPGYVVEVAKKIAEIKNLPLEEIEKATLENAKKLFKIN